MYQANTMFPKIPHGTEFIVKRIDCVRLRLDFIRITSENIIRESSMKKISNEETKVKPAKLKMQSG
ncbi:hypothetical protein COF07_10245 [Bacillus wiedmannii]|nr:hypothetical protein COF07_10245 [Bacillus wiedmannii]